MQSEPHIVLSHVLLAFFHGDGPALSKPDLEPVGSLFVINNYRKQGEEGVELCIYNTYDILRYAFKILNQEALYRESNHLGMRVPSTSPKLERDKFKIGSGD